MTPSSLIGVDIGGTKINAGLVQNGAVKTTSQKKTPAQEDIDTISAAILDTILEVKTNDVKAVGLGVPGLVDAGEGVVQTITNIPALSDYPLAQFLENNLGCPVYLDNDANCFAVGEKHFGAGRSYNHIVALTLGTGLGAALILDGTLYNGKIGGAGEIGCLKYLDRDLEYYCSSEFFKDRYGADGLTCAKAAGQGEAIALQIFREYGRHLGEAINMALAFLDPEVIILGGSITNAHKYFKSGIEDVLDQFPLKRISEGVEVIVGSLNDSAILGAAALHYDHEQR